METNLLETGEMPIHVRPGNIDDAGICNEVQTNDSYSVRELCRSGFRPRRILDLGGHIGTFTRMAAKYWPEAIIHVYECVPSTFQLLRLNTEGFGNIIRYQNCVMGFYMEEEGNDVFPSNEMEQAYRKHRHPCVVSIREVMQRIGSVDLMKIDVEQSEVNILRHLDKLDMLKDIEVINGEWHFDTAKQDVRSILGKTHTVELVDEGQWNLFRARRK